MLADRREAFYEERLRISAQFHHGFDKPSSEIALYLLYTCDVLQQLVSRYMAEAGLSKSTFNILAILRHGPEAGMQLHDLGELLLVSRANITGLIDHLEEKALVRRVVDTQDRRARLARITEKGRRVFDEFLPAHSRNLKTLLQGLTSEDKTALVNLLRSVRISLAANVEAIAPTGVNGRQAF